MASPSRTRAASAPPRQTPISEAAREVQQRITAFAALSLVAGRLSLLHQELRTAEEASAARVAVLDRRHDERVAALGT